ncbi:MAG: sulfatase-like hydrolase/transferase, partial [Armatimonadetes bacterium]|nr:sulfatase-like hydrolase/transferase [Armatimonadota bacterium]NIO98089.1 sulfatase-like hydrolase/transferase [Armatimonadota bacterium]
MTLRLAKDTYFSARKDKLDMRIFRCALSPEFVGVAGALAGAVLGQTHRLEIRWLFDTYPALGGAAVGWLAGLILALAFRWAVRRLRKQKMSRSDRRRLRKQKTSPMARWRKVVLAVITLLALLAGARAAGIVFGSTRPNLILITIDTLRTDHLGAYGSDRGLTPNLDVFAQESTLYEAAYVPSPWTLPSFGAMFTGRPPSACGLKTDASELTKWYYSEATLPEDVPILSQALREAGYYTAAIITNPFLSRQRGLNRGFDYFLHESEAPKEKLREFQAHQAFTVTEHARGWLAQNRQEPFFLWLHYLDPHVPYASPDTPETLRNKYPEQWKIYRRYWYHLMSDAPPPIRDLYIEFCRKMYAEEVRYVDRWVGVLLEELRRSEIYDETLVVITSDHGEELFDHGGFEHGHSLHEEVLWVPLLIKWPQGWQADKRIKQTTALMDLAPTFLKAADAPPMEGMCDGEWARQDGA